MIFDGTDLSDYGLTVKKLSPASFLPPIKVNHVEIADKAYDFRAYLNPRIIRLDVVVTGTNKANLIGNLDNISKLLNPVEGIKHLILDFPDDRFYKAKPNSPIDWEIVTHKLARAGLGFICPDPLGYSTSETSTPHNIDVAPTTTVTEATEGTAYIEPVYTLTAGDILDTVTIKVKNLDTAEEIQWIGSLAIGQKLTIDVANWIVKKEGAADMADVSGQFPRLLPSASNSITVTGFLTNGSLNIKYRNTYL